MVVSDKKKIAELESEIEGLNVIIDHQKNGIRDLLNENKLLKARVGSYIFVEKTKEITSK